MLQPPEKCYYKNQLVGAGAKVCKGPSAVHRADYVGGPEDPSTGEDPEGSGPSINNLQTREAGIMVELHLEGKPCTMDLDTGASLTIVSEKIWKDISKDQALDKSSVRLTTYTGEAIEILGQKDVLVEYQNQRCCLPLVVVGGQGPALFGRNWLEHLNLDWGSIKTLRTELDQLLQKHEALFKDELSTMKGVEVHLDKPVRSFTDPDRCHMP